MKGDRTWSKGQLIPLRFMQADVAASQTDVQLPIAEVRDVAAGADDQNAVDEISMPWDGEIVGISYNLSAAGSAGTLTVGATINGTEDADTTISVGTNQRGTLKVPRGQVTFVAGDRIGVELTTDGSWNGTTADIQVTVFALVELTGI